MMEPNSDPEKKPKQAKKISKKPKRKIKTDSLNGDPLTALSAFFAKAEDPTKIKHRNDIKQLHGVMGEYLSSYIVIGYTPTGKHVAHTYAISEQDMDALSTGLQRYIVESFSRPNFPPGTLD